MGSPTSSTLGASSCSRRGCTRRRSSRGRWAGRWRPPAPPRSCSSTSTRRCCSIPPRPQSACARSRADLLPPRGVACVAPATFADLTRESARLRFHQGPERTGEVEAPRSGASTSPVPPRARGDGSGRFGSRTPPYGSPPRAWGRRKPASPLHPRLRFTPTRVGTAARRTGRCSTATVHPHARGDGGVFQPFAHDAGGSPPRAWGRPTS